MRVLRCPTKFESRPKEPQLHHVSNEGVSQIVEAQTGKAALFCETVPRSAPRFPMMQRIRTAAAFVVAVQQPVISGGAVQLV
jgi:hypothetical protein